MIEDYNRKSPQPPVLGWWVVAPTI